MGNIHPSYQFEIDRLTTELNKLNEAKEPSQSMISIFEKDLLYYQKLKRRSLQFAELNKKIKSELALMQNDSIHDLSKAISEMKDFEDAISLHGKNAKEVFQGQAGNNHYGVIQKIIYDHSKIKKKAEDLFDVCF